MTFGERLREERKRLGMNQTELALLGGVVKFTQINYEKDERTPDVDYLLKLQRAGVDAYFLLTGSRTPAATSEELFAFPQRLENMVNAEQLKGVGSAVLVRDLLQVTQKLALKLKE